MLTQDIAKSKGFASLAPQAAVLFVMLVPHFNAHGKMLGGTGYIKDLVCPFVPYLDCRSIPKLLKEISAKTSVKYFEHQGRWFLHSLHFNTRHQNLNLDRLGPDDMPSYSESSPEVVRDKSGVVTSEVEEEVEEEVEDIVNVVPGICWGTPEDLVAKYNLEAAEELSAVEVLSPARRAKFSACLKHFPKCDFWTEVFAETKKSAFLRGLKPSPGHEKFRASLDWLVAKGKDGVENCVKVWEAKYRD